MSLTKKQSILLAVTSFLVGITLGMILTGRNGKVVVNGDNNVVKAGYNSHNGKNNSMSRKSVEKNQKR